MLPMRNLRKRAGRSATLILSGAAATFFSQDALAAGGPRESVWHWRGEVSRDKAIKVLAVRGTVEVQGYDGEMVEITARRRSSDVDPEVVQIALQETADEFQVVTEYPPPPLGPPRECLWYDPVRGNFWDYFVIVELGLRVPRDQSVSVHTYTGDIIAADLAGSAVVSTNDGTIRLGGLEGEIEARTEGDIVADLRKGDGGPRSIRLSVNGGTVDVILRPLERLRIGSRLVVPDITKPLEILRADGPFPATITGTLEGGGRSLTIQVKRGSASVRTLVSASQP